MSVFPTYCMLTCMFTNVYKYCVCDNHVDSVDYHITYTIYLTRMRGTVKSYQKGSSVETMNFSSRIIASIMVWKKRDYFLF